MRRVLTSHVLPLLGAALAVAPAARGQVAEPESVRRLVGTFAPWADDAPDPEVTPAVTRTPRAEVAPAPKAEPAAATKPAPRSEPAAATKPAPRPKPAAATKPTPRPKPAPAPEPAIDPAFMIGPDPTSIPDPAPAPAAPAPLRAAVAPDPDVLAEPAGAPHDADLPSPEQVLHEMGVPPEPDEEAAAATTIRLRDALVQALEHAPDLEVSRLAPAIAEASLERERAGWDARLEAGFNNNDSTRPATSNVDRVSTQETTSVEGEMRFVQPNRTGGELSAGWTQGRQTTNSTRTFRNPTYTTSFQVRYAQPLLRGGGRRVTQRGVNLAEVDLQVQRWNLLKDVLDTLGSTERAYWNLAAARERVHVARLNLQDAEILLQRSRYRVDAGTLAGVSLLEAEAAVAERRDLVLVAERNEQVAHNELVALVAPPPRPGFRLPELADLPAADLPAVPSPESMISQALGNSPEYRAAIAQLESREIELSFSKDALQPRLDLVSSMTLNGIESGTSRAIADAGSLDFPTYFVGLEFALPLGRRAAKADLRRRKLELERALRQVKALELRLEGQVLDLIQRYRTDTQRLEVSRRRVDAARAKVDAEEQRFLSGLLNADDILRFQADLASARGSEVGARAQASISAMEIWLAAGTLLGRRGITLDEAQYALADAP